MTEIKIRLSGTYKRGLNQQLREHMVQLERLASIGCLTSHICHEITNPLQAIVDAPALTLEETVISEILKLYVNLSQSEAQRVAFF
jgi:nitrogen-specific signal transduction histidine kinase